MLKKQFGKIIIGMLLSILLISVSTPVQAQDTKAIIGTWKGIIDPTSFGQGKLEFTITFSSDEKDVVTGAIDVQGQTGLEIGDIRVEKKDISFTLIVVSATFKGKLNEEGKKITGEFTQNGLTMPFEMELQEKKDK